jgi:DNA polymerase
MKKKELKELKKQMLKDQSLMFYHGATQLVFGEGNPDAKIFFLGEAPGYWEDREGRPFVGRAGQLLERMLAKVNLARNDVYISNLVYYRPPRNRNPLLKEIAAFEKYINREIEIIKPKIIVTLGRFALSKFLPGENISKIHGKIRKIVWNGQNVTIIPMYHPAAALRSLQIRSKFEKDFMVLKKLIKNG